MKIPEGRKNTHTAGSRKDHMVSPLHYASIEYRDTQDEEESHCLDRDKKRRIRCEGCKKEIQLPPSSLEDKGRGDNIDDG